MEGELICNFRKCRKPIKSDAWVTSCSHIFCPEDGDREFRKDLICPACNTKLNGKFDIIKMDTNPDEKYKAIILAGLNPETIMEVASRALSFWDYQVQQELIYRQNLATKHEEQRNQVEELQKQTFNKYQSEMNNMSKELEYELMRSTFESKASKLEVIGQKKRSAELSEKLMEKSRQLQKVQSMYENLRRKCISPLNAVVPYNRSAANFELPLKAPDMFKIQGPREGDGNHDSTSFDQNFVFFANETSSGANERTRSVQNQFADFTHLRN